MDDLTPYVGQAALKWCGEKERETSLDDIRYFEANWWALPGLKHYVMQAAIEAQAAALTAAQVREAADKARIAELETERDEAEWIVEHAGYPVVAEEMRRAVHNGA